MMNKKYLMRIIYLLLSASIEKCKGENIDLELPDGFLVGAASSAYQIEGAWNYSDKGESIWDHFTHNFPQNISDYSNGDTTCNSFHNYKDDIQLIKNIGLNHYRFSLSWSRILPTGLTTNFSDTGVRYYHKILDELEKYNITPVVTIYHVDHPQSLEKFGGWLNESMAYAFADYAAFIFQEFGNRVKHFVTINEISIQCTYGYGMGSQAPGIYSPGKGEYSCAHNMLKGHALAYHIYNEKFREKQKGLVGFTEMCHSYYNKDGKDPEAKNIAFAFNCGWTMNPIFSAEGNYPKIMIRRIKERSKVQGYNNSRLPTFSENWIKYIKGSADFLGLNHYASMIVKQLSKNEQLNWPRDAGLEISFDPNWASTEFPMFKIAPKGLGDILRLLKKEFNNPPIYILENGIATKNGTNDTSRIEYLYSYMKEMLIAIKHDQCNVKMYTIWSLMDSFEWLSGYTLHFGLGYVDFNDKTLNRTLKNSSLWLKSVIQTRKLRLNSF